MVIHSLPKKIDHPSKEGNRYSSNRCSSPNPIRAGGYRSNTQTRLDFECHAQAEPSSSSHTNIQHTHPRTPLERADTDQKHRQDPTSNATPKQNQAVHRTPSSKYKRSDNKKSNLHLKSVVTLTTHTPHHHQHSPTAPVALKQPHRPSHVVNLSSPQRGYFISQAQSGSSILRSTASPGRTHARTDGPTNPWRWTQSLMTS